MPFYRNYYLPLSGLLIVAAGILARWWVINQEKGRSPRGVTSLLYYLDHDNALWARDIQQIPDSGFVEVDGTELNLGFYPGTAWLVVTVNGLDPNGPDIISLTGDNLPFETRAFEHRNFLFPLKIESGEAKTLILKISTYG